MEEAQHIFFALVEAQQEVVAGAARLAAAAPGVVFAGCGLRLVEGQPLGEDRFEAAAKAPDQTRRQPDVSSITLSDGSSIMEFDGLPASGSGGL